MHGSKIHLNVTKDQFFASIREDGVTYYIDPFHREASQFYITYDIRNDAQSHEAVHCQMKSDQSTLAEDPSSSDELFQRRGDFFTLKTYRIAVTGDSGFTAFHGGTVADAIDAITVIINRINSVYEREVAVRFILIARNDELIFPDAATDPFDPIAQGDQQAMMNQNQTTVSSILSNGEYDVGQVWNTKTNDAPGQGIARLGSVCGNNIKARGSSGRPNPVGDAFTIAIICHELGHQFNANHTMYHCQNVNFPTSFSPGSGTTMMSYAGICGSAANVVSTSEDYFHTNSIGSIINFTRVGQASSCAQDIDFGNSYPDAILDYPNLTYIPVNTAFYLEGSGVDAESPTSALTYTWEQYNSGNRNYEMNPWDLTKPINNEPIYRSREPSPSPRRYFPSLPVVVNASNYIWEPYPTYARDLKFRMTVRDNAAENGGAAWEEMDIKVIDNSAAGLFELTSFNVKDTIKSGGYVEVTWNVAETDLPPISTDKVNIRLSVDGGTSFPYLLKEGTPNDGSTYVNIPDTTANRFRFMVEATNNIYYDVTNRSGLLCRDTSTAAIGLTYNDEFFDVCTPATAAITINTFGLGGFDDLVDFELTGSLPDGAVASFSEPQVMVGTPTTLTVNLDGVTTGGDFEIGFRVTGTGIDPQERTLDLRVTANNFDNLTLDMPANGSANVDLIPTLSWTGADDADTYKLELSDQADFSNVIFDVESTTSTTASVDDLLEAGKVYFWRVKPTNSCGELDLNRVSSFQTKALTCEEYCSSASAVFIPSATPFDAELEINIGAAQSPDEVNITEIRGNHQQISDVNFYIEGPDGTRVLLEGAGYCPTGTNMNFGFDDDAVGVLPNCAMPTTTYNSGTRFEPEESLSALNGISGSVYTLIMEDINAGFGGRFDSWCVELCGAGDLEGASLIKADSIHLPILSSRTVGVDKLEVTHTQYSASELTITLVTIPEHGSLLFDGIPSTAGGQFSMQAVIDNRLVYQHENTSADIDDFTFIVTDPGGGFLGTPAIVFYVGGTAVYDNLPEGSSLSVYPNPTRSMLHIAIEGAEISLDQITIRNLQGQLVSQLNNVQTSRENIDVSNMPAGLYFMEVTSGPYRVTRKFIKE